MNRTITLLLAACLLILIVVFTVQNSGDTPVAFLFWNFHGSLAMMLLVTFASGILIAILAAAALLKRS